MTKTLVVLQARMGSTRLPGKVLAELGGRPMLGFMLARLARLEVDELVVATTTAAADDAVADVARSFGAGAVRGSEQDVLDRFALALRLYPADVVIRLTADCPLIDPALVNAILSRHLDVSADYTSNTLVRTYPDGLDVEVLAAQPLVEAAAEAMDPVEREHVTPFVYRRPDRYRLVACRGPVQLGAERWTVDTAADLHRVRSIVARLDDPILAGWQDVLAVAGRSATAGSGATSLRPCEEAHEREPAVRRWIALRDGEPVGWAEVEVHDGGIGRVRGSIDGADLVTVVRSALESDYQVTSLVGHEVVGRNL